MYDKLRLPLKISEVEFRQGRMSGNKISYLAYKDARVDQNRLDRAVGPGYWQRKHDVIDAWCMQGVRRCVMIYHVEVSNFDREETDSRVIDWGRKE